MAINCTDKIVDPTTEFLFLAPNIPYVGEITDLNDGDFYEYEMYEFETMDFVIRIFPQTAQPIEVELVLFKIVDDVAIEMGTSFIGQFYNEFNYDGEPNSYRFCLKSRWKIEYELEVQFTDYPFTLFPEFDCYHGSRIPPFEFALVGYECEAQIGYKIIEGELPPGLYISSSGFIYGIPEELDRSTPPKYLPSFTFYEPAPAEGLHARASVSYDFPLTIRAFLVEEETSFEDRDFLICVRNNWDYDKAAFLAGLPNFERKKYTETEIKGEALPVETEEPGGLCECPEVEIVPTLRPLTTEEISILCDVCQINEEFAGLVEINNGNCTVCEPEEITQSVLQDIDPVCVPCEAETEQEGLQDIPASMCPVVCPVELEATVAASRVLYEAIPGYCAPEFLAKMFEEKVDLGYHVCPERNAIYPETAAPAATIVLPETLCEEICDDEH